MFERFTKEARQIVVTAVTEANARGDSRLGSEHLLIATVGVSFPFDRSVLGPLNVGPVGVRDQLDRLDSDSLASVGFDPDLLRPTTSDTGSEGRSKARRHLPLTHGAKSVIAGSLRQAIKQGERHIGTEHVLLSLLAVPPEDPVARVLKRLGADPVALRTAIEASLRRAS